MLSSLLRSGVTLCPGATWMTPTALLLTSANSSYKLLQGDIVRSDDELVCQAGEHREGLLLCLELWEGSQTDTGDN